jgi:hypothetical protein
LKFRVANLWRKEQQSFDIADVQKVFQEVLEELGFEEHHDVLGCKDCEWDGGDFVYCPRSRSHKDHPFHVCPVYQLCCGTPPQ